MSLRSCCLGLLLPVLGCGRSSHDAAEAGTGASVTTVAGDAAQPEAVPMDAVLAELTQVVRRFGAERRAVPQGLEELVAHGYLGQLPPAPAGKRFVITRDLRVVLEEGEGNRR